MLINSKNNMELCKGEWPVGSLLIIWHTYCLLCLRACEIVEEVKDNSLV